MARITLWNSGKKGNDFKFSDRVISEFFTVSGTAVYVHLYEGVYDQTSNSTVTNITSIQDPLYLENRDRKYSDTVYETRGIYQINDETDFSLSQFGMMFESDTLFIEFHLNDLIARLGRRIIAGDVIELPHRRDNTSPTAKPANKFYVVKEADKAADGYSSTWYPHIWRIQVKPMTASQEYQDILDKQATDPFGLDTSDTLGDILSTATKEFEINEQVVENAKANFIRRNFETQQFYYIPGSEDGLQNPWIFAGDGIPPNGAQLIGSGHAFPDVAQEGDFFLRTDYMPSTLFQRVSSAWKIKEVAYREYEWEAAHRILKDYLSNDKMTTFRDGYEIKQRQNLSQVLKPKADF
jgi:hypothetical protein